jgi:hypothetical protein
VIDFRYHLISIVAVFLALGIGILMGSLVLGESLVKQIRSELDRIENTNRDLRDSVSGLQDQVQLDEDFAILARANLIDGQLDGDQVVLFTYQGTDGALMDQVRGSLEEAGGAVAATVEATDNLALDTAAARDQLALALGSASNDSAELRAELGTELGGDAASAARSPQPAGPPSAAQDAGSGARALSSLLSDLEQADFITVDGAGGDKPVVPAGASFIVVGGAPDDPPFRLAEYTVSLANALSRDGNAVVGAESSTSLWGMTTMLRADDRAQDELNTVDHAESITGSVALVLGLEEAEAGILGNHYGIGTGAERIIPEPEPSP